MLKALELAGFKSFADRTRFDFPDGITVVVGPNGSGKSNIVDAMKWVLGSQSAKSLRGKDMSDVIFKGSQTRGPAGSAEVTIIFDNSGGELPVDAPEVHVTRRVYRSGEGEYLINNQAVRLKDLKNLIRGTGIGIDAYSLIEQGKVDKMLNASAKDRRAIFEEAAGISRFKAKKIEAERRLARVQSNLTRLGDIVDEVASRLKSLRSQASKAERYRQASERMKELRLQIAWTDWRSFSSELENSESELATALKNQTELEKLRSEMTEKRQAADAQLQQIADDARSIEETRSGHLSQIASLEGRRDADEASIVDLRKSVASSLRRMRLLQTQAGSAAAELRGANEKLEAYESELKAVRGRSEEAESNRDKIQAEASEVRRLRDELGQKHLAGVRRVADAEAKRQRTEQRLAEVARTMANLSRRIATAQTSLAEATAEAETGRTKVTELDESIAAAAKEVELADAKLAESRRTLARRREEVSALKIRLQGVTERQKVLDDLQRRQDGISGGVQAILKQINQPGADRSSSIVSKHVHGIVADCFDVDVNVAPLIDAALGEKSQYLIVTGGEVQKAIVGGSLKLSHRVGLIRIDELPARRPGDRIRLDGLRGVVGRGDRMVKCDEKFEPLVRHLLSNTWLVDSLETALGLRKLSGAGLRFVSSACELLENDGSTVVGPAAAATGLVSRRSELLAAGDEIKHYQYQLQEAEAETERLSLRVDEEAAMLGRAEQTHRGLITDRAAAEAERRHCDERLQSQSAACDEINAEIAASTGLREAATAENNQLASTIHSGKQEVERLELETAEADEMLSETQDALQTATAGVMSISVELARAEQKFEALSAAMQQQRRDQSQREAAVAEVREQADHGRSRIADLKTRMLDASNRLASLNWDAEQCDRSLGELAQAAAEVRRSNRDILKASERAIKDAAAASEAVHAITARHDNAKLRRETLVTRLLEDYEIDLQASEPPEDFQEPESRDEIETEINTLRSQLQRTTSINMEALEELEELQSRYDELHGQYQDLTAAKDSLQRIIGRINADSRRLFMDTLEAIRVNFQQLYRKSFGGGHADLVLEESDDPLEAGVEIVATPPGKPSFNNSLLSGGEKALTAVALLMSIFKYRPSPFCVLDEVDAPFDEANIGRFVTVLNEFLDHSKFVVVTHSKKTMTAATTLYGVTMQESGVSKRVSIRFEDVSDDGEISDGEAA
ncbi:Chromosome partition protein Smc [Rubripirellula obstinata]|uniref:Chromosome partition protein Smc n=1 Tax=Rubripirellula obstinata TaxID=406547 RepID=A0A5B1CGD0_9BACT|nr:chromosome segregation protein SMC [Rubripirellula obstinata]KAA1258995.1 Chromosome partition protein Smc [Rubripirellula obstinata]